MKIESSVSDPRSPRFHFGPFTVDPHQHCLLRDGTRILIQEQPFQVLLALLEDPGHVVTRDHLRQRLWGAETFVDFDQSLHSAVRRLRVALADNPRTPTYVATIPRLGLRFLAPVTTDTPIAPDIQSTPSARQLPSPWYAAAAAAVLLLLMLLGASTLHSSPHPAPPPPLSRQASLAPISPDLQQRPSGSAPSPTNDPHLVELTGWYHLGRRTEVGYTLAQHSFEQTLLQDPRSTSAMVGLAESQILLALNANAPADRLQAARSATIHALQIAPNLAEAHTLLGTVDALERWDGPAAEREFRTALRLDPKDFLGHLWFAMFVLAPQHRYTEAEQQARLALGDAPLSLIAHTDLGWILASQGKHDAALDQFRFVLNIDPSFVPARFRMQQLLRSEGKLADAASFPAIDPPGPPDAIALRHLTNTTTHAFAGLPASSVDPCTQATADLTTGSRDSLSIARSAVGHRCPTFFFFGQDPTFLPLHNSPEFAALERTAFLPRP